VKQVLKQTFKSSWTLKLSWFKKWSISTFN